MNGAGRWARPLAPRLRLGCPRLRPPVGGGCESGGGENDPPPPERGAPPRKAAPEAAGKGAGLERGERAPLQRSPGEGRRFPPSAGPSAAARQRPGGSGRGAGRGDGCPRRQGRPCPPLPPGGAARPRPDPGRPARAAEAGMRALPARTAAGPTCPPRPRCQSNLFFSFSSCRSAVAPAGGAAALAAATGTGRERQWTGTAEGRVTEPIQLLPPPPPLLLLLRGQGGVFLQFSPLSKMSTSDKERPPQLLFVKALASRGRIEAIAQQMGYHPHYLDSFLRLQHYLLHMDGPLPFDCRHFIAIMAAARHRCRYLVNLHVLQFLRVGGDPLWLRGLDCIPPKLRRLSEINKVLAHRPWLVCKEHIEKLLKISEQSWSLAELVHAVVLLAHYHALASFAFGCGCEQDLGPEGRASLKLGLPGSICFCDVGNGCSQELLHLNRKRSLDSCVELESLRERVHRLQVGSEAREELRLPAQREEGFDGEFSGAADLSCYVLDPSFGYQEFAQCNEDQPQIFRVQDYSWEDHGFSLVNRLYSDIGHLLDEKFRTVDSLHSCSMAKRQGCEHATFKRGLWNYIHCMFGIRYDDYDYAEVNHLLERILKLYIKTVTCSPEKMDPQMFERFWKQFKHSEKVHVNLLILEARLQAELLYALRAITHYMVS